MWLCPLLSWLCNVQYHLSLLKAHLPALCLLWHNTKGKSRCLLKKRSYCVSVIVYADGHGSKYQKNLRLFPAVQNSDSLIVAPPYSAPLLTMIRFRFTILSSLHDSFKSDVFTLKFENEACLCHVKLESRWKRKSLRKKNLMKSLPNTFAALWFSKLPY